MTMGILRVPAWRNISIGGYGWGDLLADSAHLTLLRAGARGLVGKTDVLVMNGGQDDFFEGNTGAVGYGRAVTYANLARSYGYHYIVGVTLPAFGIGPPYNITQAMVDEKDAANALMLAAAPYPTGPFDVIADGASGVLANPYDSEYFLLDLLHLRLRGLTYGGGGGGQVLAQRLATALEALPVF